MIDRQDLDGQLSAALLALHNLLFSAAWPMLAACFALDILRDLHTRWSLSARSTPVAQPT